MKKDVFKISKDFVLTKLVESIYIDVKYKGYDLQLIVQYEMDNGVITKFEVWSGAKDYKAKYLEFVYDNRMTKYKFQTIEAVIDFVHYNFEKEKIRFLEIINLIKEG